MTFDPILIDLTGTFIGVRTVDKNDPIAVAVGLKEIVEILLGAPRLGEDDRFFQRAKGGCTFEGGVQGG